MCISPLPQETLANMRRFQYKSTDASIFYGKCLSPCLNKFMNYFPTFIAPNLITLFSLICNIIGAVITYLDAGFDFSLQLKSRTCFIIGTTQFLYLLLDNIDGKQARKTGTSSPFGMLMDHGCDIFTNIFTAFNLSHLMMVGNKDIYSFSVFFGLILGFYMMTYEEYTIGEMHFPPINGTDEGNLFVSLFGVILAFTGQEWLCSDIYDPLKLTVGKAMGIVVAIGGLSTIFNLYLHTIQKKTCRDCLTNFLDNFVFYGVVIVPIIFIIYRNTFYMTYNWIILINCSLLFARITMDTQIKIVTLDTVGCNFMFIFSNVLFIASIFIYSTRFDLYLLCGLASAQFAELAMFIYFRANEITDYLGIKIFRISRMEQI